ncbi:hypothetical protein ACP3V3_01770 [Vibrio sp. PNB22_3_1]
MNSQYLLGPGELDLGESERDVLLEAIREGGVDQLVGDIFHEKMMEKHCWDESFSGTRSALDCVYENEMPSLAVALSRLDRARLYCSDASSLFTYLALSPLGSVGQEPITTLLSRFKVKTMPEIKRWLSTILGENVTTRTSLTLEHYDNLLADREGWGMIDYFAKTPYPSVIQRCAVMFGLAKTKTLESVEACFGGVESGFQGYLTHSLSGIAVDMEVARSGEFAGFSRAWLVMIAKIARVRNEILAAGEVLDDQQQELYFLMLVAIRSMVADISDEVVLIEALNLDPNFDYYKGVYGVLPIRSPYCLHSHMVDSLTLRSCMSLMQGFNYGSGEFFRFYLKIADQLIYELLSAKRSGVLGYNEALGAPMNHCLPGSFGMLGWGVALRLFRALSFEMMYVESRLLPITSLRIDDALSVEGEDRCTLLAPLLPFERQWADFRLRVIGMMNALLRASPFAVYGQLELLIGLCDQFDGVGKKAVAAHEQGAGRYQQLLETWREAVANERFDDVAELSAELAQFKSDGTHDWLSGFSGVLDEMDLDALTKSMDDVDRFSLRGLAPVLGGGRADSTVGEVVEMIEGDEDAVIEDLKAQLKRSRADNHSLKAQLDIHNHHVVTRTKVDSVTLSLLTEARVSLASVFAFIKNEYAFVEFADDFEDLIAECKYEQPRKLLGALVALCQDYVPAILSGQPDATARHCIDRFYSANESATTMSSDLAEQRDFSVGKQVYRMEQHLTIGVARCPQKCVQVFFKIVESRLLIGYVGRHLPVSGS